MTNEEVQGPDRSVAAVERTVSILNAFVSKPGSLTLSDLQNETGLFKSVILRYMITLLEQQLVVRNPDGTFRLGNQIIRLAAAFERSVDYPELVKPVLQSLVDRSGETASFYVREGSRRICMFRQNSPQSLRVDQILGAIAPLDDTSTGQVLRLAEEFPRVNGSYLRQTSGIIDPLTTSISAPIFGVNERLIGALTLSGPIGRFKPGEWETRALVWEHASRLSRSLGSEAHYLDIEEEPPTLPALSVESVPQTANPLQA